MTEAEVTSKDDNACSSLKKMQILVGLLAVTTFALLVSTSFLAVDANSSSSISTITVIPTTKPPSGTNPCEGKKPDAPNVACVVDEVNMTGEQAGANVTEGYQGDFNTTAVPITEPYYKAGLCK
jgi:hypothetical protein